MKEQVLNRTPKADPDKSTHYELLTPGQFQRALEDARIRRERVLANRPLKEPVPTKPWGDMPWEDVPLLDEASVDEDILRNGPPRMTLGLPSGYEDIRETEEAPFEVVYAPKEDAPDATATTALPLNVSEEAPPAAAGRSLSDVLPRLPHFGLSRRHSDDAPVWKTADEKRRRTRIVAGLSGLVSFTSVLALGWIGAALGLFGDAPPEVVSTAPGLASPPAETVALNGDIGRDDPISRVTPSLAVADGEVVLSFSEPVSHAPGDVVASPKVAVAANPALATEGLAGEGVAAESDGADSVPSDTDVALAAAPAAEVEPETPAPTPQVVIHAPDTISDTTLGGISSDVAGAGHEVVRTGRPGFTVSTTHVRFYHSEDRAVAEELAELVGGAPRDFTDYEPRPAQGLVEVWLAGVSEPVVENVQLTADVARPAPREALIEDIVQSILNQ